MSTRTTDYREAIEHLPAGAILVFHEVSWEDYEQLLDDLRDHPGVRLTFDQGRLEIMSPLPEHEEYKEFIARLVYVLCDELGLKVEPRGSATWRKKRDAKGTEPDTCFYIANAGQIIGKRRIDLNVDPPPDIVVEIDTTNESSGKLPIYSTFGVPEVWQYDGKRNNMVIYELRDQSYAEVQVSRSFPFLTGGVLAHSIEHSKTEGQDAALAAFRQWIRARNR